MLVTLAIAHISPVAGNVWGWDSSTKVTLSERSVAGPGLAYDPPLSKLVMTWIGSDTSHLLNFISSADMRNWSGKITTSLSVSAAASCINDPPDMTYDPDDGNIYVAYEAVDVNLNPTSCGANYIDIFHTANGGSTLSSIVTVATSACSTCINQAQMSGPSITYDTSNHRFVVANTQRFNNEGTVFVYTSTDGATWSNGQVVSVTPGAVFTRPEIRFINGFYFLTYGSASDGYAHIRKSSDLNTWTTVSDTIQSSAHSFRFVYNPSENMYHLGWRGIDLYNQINDALSPDAVSWPTKNVFENTQDEPAFTLNPIANVLLLAWTGTDCCLGGSLNLMQYRSVPDFTMSVSPSQTAQFYCTPTQVCPASQTTTLTVTPRNGFSGTVSLTYLPPNPSGLTQVTGPSSVVISGGSVSVTLTAYHGTQSGLFVWTIQGQSGSSSAASATFTINEYVCTGTHCPT